MKRTIPFSRFGAIGLIISMLVTGSLIGVTIYRGGFNLGIDFKSGQSIDLIIDNAKDIDEIKNSLETAFDNVLVTRIGNVQSKGFNIKLSSTVENQESDLAKVISILEEKYTVTLQSTAFIGAGISQQLFKSVLVLTLGALGLILLYVWLRFKLHFALAALVALLHDILFIVGVVGAFHIEVSTSTVAAILTIIGYSLNDTIVIFDRVRENIVLIRDGNFKHIVNTSITQTLSRTIITSFTTLLAVFSLMIFASGEVYNFARTLMIGIIEGTWSSLFIATPLLYVFNTKKILATYRKKQGSGVQYAISSTDVTAPTAARISNSKESTVSQNEVQRIKAEVLSRQHHKKKKK